jgi:hypothetical protein
MLRSKQTNKLHGLGPRANYTDRATAAHVEVTNRFAGLKDLDAEVEINSAWETIIENIKISAKESLGYYGLKKHKPRFEEGCSKLLDHRKQDNCSGYRIHVK